MHELLTRDLKNVLDFFSRKHKIKLDVEEAYAFVVGKAEKLKIEEV